MRLAVSGVGARAASLAFSGAVHGVSLLLETRTPAPPVETLAGDYGLEWSGDESRLLKLATAGSYELFEVSARRSPRPEWRRLETGWWEGLAETVRLRTKDGHTRNADVFRGSHGRSLGVDGERFVELVPFPCY